MRSLNTAALVAFILLVSACASAGDAEPVTTTVPPITNVATSVATEPGSSTTAATATTSPPATTTTQAPEQEPPFDRWIAVMASLPVGESTAEDADIRSNEIAAPESGVLLSDDYPSLNPGFWVVYSGVFDFDWEAQQRCDQLGGDCYERYLGDDPSIAPTLANGRVLVWLEGSLVVVDTLSGTVLRTVSSSWGDGQFTGPPDLAGGGTVAYFDTGGEDSWFSCESTIGGFSRMDMTTGEAELDTSGIIPEVSPRGDLLAYASADECLVDPDEAQFFIAYHNTVTVRDLTTGTKRTWRPAPGTDPGASTIYSLAWSADASTLYVSLADGTIQILPLKTSTDTPIQSLEGLEYFLDHSTIRVEMIGELTSGELVLWSVAETEGDFPAFVDLFDPATETATTLLSGPTAFASIDSTASTVLFWDDHTLWAQGAHTFEFTFDRYIGGAGG